MANKSNDEPIVTDVIEIDFDELLKTKIKLSDGTDEFIFSRGPKYSDKLWPIQCHLCRVGYMINEKKLRSHLLSDKHIVRLAEPTPDATAFRKPYQQLYSDRLRLMNPIKILPGEFIEEVTTKYADRLMPCKQYNWESLVTDDIKNKLLKDDIIMKYNEIGAPVLGICYTFKMLDADNKVVYHCSLCNMFLWEYNAYQHFVGLNSNHFDQFMKRHFENLLKQISKLIDKGISNDEKAKWIKNIVRSVYKKIEEWKGVRQFHIIDWKSFEQHRAKFVAKARKLLHYGDTAMIFSDAEILSLIDKCRKGDFLPDDPDRLPSQPAVPIDIKEEKLFPDQRKRKNDNQNTESVSEKKKSLNTQDKQSNRRRGGSRFNDSPENWNKYRNLVERALNSLNYEYGQFVDLSENHPKYSDEWKKFWRRRSLELENDNIDPNQYNFMPEWNRFWIRYLEDCYQSDVNKCKFEIRKSLHLPFRVRTPSPFGNRSRVNDNNNSTSNYKNQRYNNSAIHADDNYFRTRDNSHYGYNNNRSGFNNDFVTNRSNADHKNQNTNFNNTRNDNVNRQRPMPLLSIDPITSELTQETEHELPTEPLSVLSVLRLLTALEDQLGSLGPTAIQLLSKAIFYEKAEKSSANELLNQNEYFMLFITALEKLKGLIIADILPPIKQKPVNKLIKDLTMILTLFEEYKSRNPPDIKDQNLSQHSQTNSGGNTGNSNTMSHNSETVNSNENMRNRNSENMCIKSTTTSGRNFENNMREKYSQMQNVGNDSSLLYDDGDAKMESTDYSIRTDNTSGYMGGAGGNCASSNQNVENWNTDNYRADNKNPIQESAMYSEQGENITGRSNDRFDNKNINKNQDHGTHGLNKRTTDYGNAYNRDTSSEQNTSNIQNYNDNFNNINSSSNIASEKQKYANNYEIAGGSNTNYGENKNWGSSVQTQSNAEGNITGGGNRDNYNSKSNTNKKPKIQQNFNISNNSNYGQRNNNQTEKIDASAQYNQQQGGGVGFAWNNNRNKMQSYGNNNDRTFDSFDSHNNTQRIWNNYQGSNIPGTGNFNNQSQQKSFSKHDAGGNSDNSFGLMNSQQSGYNMNSSGRAVAGSDIASRQYSSQTQDYSGYNNRRYE